MRFLSKLDAKLLGASLLTLLLVASCTASGRGSYRATYVTTYEPPPPRYVVVDARSGHTWVDGRWAWGGNDWVWYDGYYVAERPGYVWVQGRWVSQGGRWVWNDGRWSDRARTTVHVRERHRPHNVVRPGVPVRARVESRPAVRVPVDARPTHKVKVKGKAGVRVRARD